MGGKRAGWLVLQSDGKKVCGQSGDPLDMDVSWGRINEIRIGIPAKYVEAGLSHLPIRSDVKGLNECRPAYSHRFL